MLRPMSATRIASLEKACSLIFVELKRPWSWDARFGRVLLTFPREDKQVPAVLKQAMPSLWSSSNVSTAPARVQAIAEESGLDPGQNLLHFEAPDGAILFAAVWPWGNGKTVSVRLGFSVPDLDDTAFAACEAQLQRWFGLP
jgi:hypothetical protein